MLHFPAYPETLTSRQVECISCRELFTVSEDFVSRTRRRTDFWRLVPDRLYDILLRYQPLRTLRTVTPHMRAEYDRDANDFTAWSSSPPALINCPRCGADNRNWVALLRFPKKWWGDPQFLIGFILTVALTIGAIAAAYASVSIRWTIILALAVFLAGFIPVQSSTKHWKKLRDHKFTMPVAKPKSFWRRLPPPLRTGLTTTGVFMFLVPFILVILIPGGFDGALRLLAGEPEPLRIQVNDLYQTLSLLPEQTDEGTQTAVQNVTDSLEKLLAKAGVPVTQLNTLSPDQELTIILNMLRRMARNASEKDAAIIAAIISGLEQYAEAANLEIDQSSLPDWFPVPVAFLRSWLLYTLAASIAGISFGWMAAERYLRFANRNLPRPIYYTVAGMTRVVVWEAKQALEIGAAEVDKMQWTNVQRNDAGGIVLIGLYRGDTAELPPEDITTRVRAEYCEIRTDKWGRIVTACIKATRAFVRPGRQANRSLGDELFERVEPAAPEQERPLHIKRP